MKLGFLDRRETSISHGLTKEIPGAGFGEEDSEAKVGGSLKRQIMLSTHLSILEARVASCSMYLSVSWLASDITLDASSVHVFPCSALETCLRSWYHGSVDIPQLRFYCR